MYRDSVRIYGEAGGMEVTLLEGRNLQTKDVLVRFFLDAIFYGLFKFFASSFAII